MCVVPEMSWAIQGGRPHSKSPLVTASLTLEYGVHVGEVELDVLDVEEVELDVDELEVVLDDVLDEVDDLEVIKLELMVGLHEQAEL